MTGMGDDGDRREIAPALIESPCRGVVGIGNGLVAEEVSVSR